MDSSTAPSFIDPAILDEGDTLLRVYMHVAFQGDEGLTVSKQALAGRVGLSKRQTVRVVNALVARGYLVAEPRVDRYGRPGATRLSLPKTPVNLTDYGSDKEGYVIRNLTDYGSDMIVTRPVYDDSVNLPISGETGGSIGSDMIVTSPDFSDYQGTGGPATARERVREQASALVFAANVGYSQVGGTELKTGRELDRHLPRPSPAHASAQEAGDFPRKPQRGVVWKKLPEKDWKQLGSILESINPALGLGTLKAAVRKVEEEVEEAESISPRELRRMFVAGIEQTRRSLSIPEGQKGYVTSPSGFAVSSILRSVQGA